MPYKETVNELINNGIGAKEGRFFAYDLEPLAHLYNSFWEAGQDFLGSDDLKTFFEFPILYYCDNPTVNAGAYLEGKYALIVVFAGLIERANSLYEGEKSAFNDDQFKDYIDVSQRFRIAQDRFLFEIIASFIIYHETGHLIQRSGNDVSYFEFMVDNCKQRVEERHVKEFDADWFASNRLAMQIMGLVTSFYGEYNSGEKVEFLHKMAELALSAVYVFIVDLAEGEPKLYFEENCHPHPAVRLTYIVFYVVDTIRFLAPIQLDQERIIRNAIMISMELTKASDPSPVEVWSKTIFEQSKEIDDYIKKIIEDCKRYPECCRNKLNTE